MRSLQPGLLLIFQLQFDRMRFQLFTAAAGPTVLMLWMSIVPALPGPSFMKPFATMGVGLALVGIPLIVIVFPVVALVYLALACVPGDAEKRLARRRWGFAFLAGAGAMLLLSAPAMLVRRWEISAAANRAAPLVQALEQFRGKHGHYPSALSQLVPDYMAEVPGTGMMGYPEWEYRLSSGDESWKELNGGKAPAYVLLANCTLPMTWDTLHYWPSGDYPAKMYGGAVEKIGAWAYVHE